jgi:murein DD-endopeptidase MepM/ murein hydrolase activator NlpD
VRARLTLILTIVAVLVTVAPSGAAQAQSASVAAPVRSSHHRAQLAAIAKQIATPPPAPMVPPVTIPATYIWPIKGPVLSNFGYRSGRRHDGIDIDGRTGTPILAAHAGTVEKAGWISGYGYTIVIDHGFGISTLYAHQSRLGARAGQWVEQGQVVGFVGATGHASTDHLHYEVRVNDVPRNPIAWL